MFVEQAVEITIKAERLTGSVLRLAMQAYVRHRGGRQVHGEQSMKDLNAQGKQLEHVTVAGQDVEQIRRELNRYEVDFHIMKAENGDYHVFFKSADIDRVHMGIEQYVASWGDREEPQPMKEQFTEAAQEAEERNAARAAEKVAEKVAEVTL